MSKMLGLNGEHPASQQKVEFWCFFGKNCKISAVKRSITKPSMLILVNLSTDCSPRLYYQLSSHANISNYP